MLQNPSPIILLLKNHIIPHRSTLLSGRWKMLALRAVFKHRKSHPDIVDAPLFDV